MKIFDKVDLKNDPYWVVKEFFNSIYQQDSFIWALPLLLSRKGCVINEEYCLFPNPDDPDPTCHFSGVLCGSMDDEVNVSDEIFQMHLREACDCYLRLHPNDKDLILKIQEGQVPGSASI